jgi:hypothetical protein
MRRLSILFLIASLSLHGYPAVGQSNSADSTVRTVKIPAGTTIDVELADSISSADIEKGDVITFRAAAPVKVDGIVVAAEGARCTAVVVKASKRRRWGRSGELTFSMRDIIAVDDQRIPLQFSRGVKGEGKGVEVASAITTTGLLLWPIAPVALLWGLKRGEHAFIPAGKRFEVLTKEEVVVKVVEQ